ncbi:MAG: hypothetical protein HYU78_00945 [Rhodocyclales bacterium]|nr:hypothetical protein [Rhodocyclales bacterium]
MNARWIATLLLCTATGMACVSCTSITIVDREGKVSVERFFGVANVTLHPGSEAVMAEIMALGYHGGPLGISLGFHQSAIAAASADCRLLVWPRNRDDATRLEQLLGAQRSGVCVVQLPVKEKQP